MGHTEINRRGDEYWLLLHQDGRQTIDEFVLTKDEVRELVPKMRDTRLRELLLLKI